MRTIVALPDAGGERARHLSGALSREVASIHLDAIRATAAIAVVASHLRTLFFVDGTQIQRHGWLWKIPYALTGLGHQAVVVFFVLSGYLVGGSVLRAVGRRRWGWGEYALQRLTRLYVVLIPALTAGLLWDLAGIHHFGLGGIYGGHYGQEVARGSLVPFLTPRIFAGNLFFLQGIVTPSLGSNGPTWSLANEFWYYLMFPLGYFLFSRKFRSGIWPRAGMAVLLVVCAAFARPILPLFPTWLAGAALFALGERRHPAAVAQPWRPAALTLMLVGAAVFLHYKAAGIAGDYLLAGLTAALIYSVSWDLRGMPPAWYRKSAQYVSLISYTLYLVHRPLLVFLTATLQRERWQPSVATIAAGAGILAVVLVYAYGMYFLFEARTGWVRGRLKGWLGDRPSETQGAGALQGAK